MLGQVDDQNCQTIDLASSMLIDLMRTMPRIDYEKLVGWIRQGLENKRTANPEWNHAVKSRSVAKWNPVKALMQKHPTMTFNEIATRAKCSVATV